MDDLMATTGATGDTILGVGKDTADFAEKAKVLGNQAQVALEPIATVVFNAMGDALTNLMPVITAFGAWAKANPEIITAIGVAIGVLAVAFVGLTVATWAMNTALLANPITWLVIAIVALIAAIVLLVMHWGEVTKGFSDTWNIVVDWFLGTLKEIGNWWNDLWGHVSDFFVSTWNAVSNFFTGLWNGIVSWFTNLLVGFALFILNTAMSIATNWSNVWNGIVSFFTGLWNGVVSFVSTVFTGIGNTILNALKWIGDTWNGMWQGMVDFLGDVFAGVVGIVKKPINGIIGILNGAISAINGIHVTIPDWVPLVGGQTWGLHLPKIPMLATGGTITASGYSIVGENGPELLKLPKGAQVNPDYDSIPTSDGVIFNNYAPLGQSPAQALTEFSNRAKGL
jgi:hypothetical protein